MWFITHFVSNRLIANSAKRVRDGARSQSLLWVRNPALLDEAPNRIGQTDGNCPCRPHRAAAVKHAQQYARLISQLVERY